MRVALLTVTLLTTTLLAQPPAQPDWAKADEETLRHFLAIIKMDTTDPPGGEKPVVDYMKQVLEAEGIPVQIFTLEPNRPNLVARLKGSGKQRPLLLLGHTDTVNVDPKKWTHPPFGGVRDGGFIYGRGTVDDKDNVVANLMTMLMLKRLNVKLDRDVIFLAEAGEEGASRLGIQFMANQHFAEIDAEFCYAEGGSLTRTGGEVKFARVQTVEKIPRAITVTAKGVAGHGSVPLESNALAHLGEAVGAIAAWTPPLRINETTAAYFKRLATVSSPAEAARYRDLLNPDPKVSGPADAYLRKNEPSHWSMLRTSLSPTMISGGYRTNVIPSEGTANIDTRLAPDEDPAKFLELVKQVVNDPQVEVSYGARDTRPPTPTARLDSEAFKVIEANITKHYKTITLPTMSTGATDMAFLRQKGMQCYGVGPALDSEDGPKGFGAHSDQERILESELYRFVRFNWDAVVDLARAK
ncbi:MAG: M20/M25/M40 family metallo-hydrolase [Vicinamibacterales bacterium]|jgi:acetylornithine deacetylase/succinyl-diaminopimelate desuccinylase-like protein